MFILSITIVLFIYPLYHAIYDINIMRLNRLYCSPFNKIHESSLKCYVGSNSKIIFVFFSRFWIEHIYDFICNHMPIRIAFFFINHFYYRWKCCIKKNPVSIVLCVFFLSNKFIIYTFEWFWMSKHLMLTEQFWAGFVVLVSLSHYNFNYPFCFYDGS